MDNSVTPQPKNTKPPQPKKKIVKPQPNNFKQKYFEFYDDVKTHNNGPYDW